MTMSERFEQQLKLGHAVVGLCVALAAPGVGVYVSFRLVSADVARHEMRLRDIEQRVSSMETQVLTAQGVTNERLGRIDENLKRLLEQQRPR